MRKTTTGHSQFNYYDNNKVREECQNHHSLCSHWAAAGYCNDPYHEDYEYMVLNCAPACQSCHLLDYDVRCPLVISPPTSDDDDDDDDDGGKTLNAVFERIVGERDLTKEQIDGGMGSTGIMTEPSHDDDDLQKKSKYHTQVEILSRPTTNNELDEDNDNEDGPWVIVIDDFLSIEECEYLIELGHELGFEQSTEYHKESGDTESEFRTSTNAWCNQSCENDPIVKPIVERISLLTGFPPSSSEMIQLLQYAPGQFYRSHHDYIEEDSPRALTVFLYLQDVEEGGATRFNDLGIDVESRRGRALIWPSVLSDDPNVIDSRTTHEALPVVKGMKYGANAWLHTRTIYDEIFHCGDSIKI